MILIHAKLRALFQSHGLRITIDKPDNKIVDFLDVKLNLKTSTISRYREPHDITIYINTKRNHPPTVIKGISIKDLEESKAVKRN